MLFRVVQNRAIIQIEAKSERHAKRLIRKTYGFIPDYCEQIKTFKNSKYHMRYAQFHEKEIYVN